MLPPLPPLLTRPPSARPPLPLTGDPSKILPRGVQLSTMQQSKELAEAWYTHLVSVGQFHDAEVFRYLLTSGGSVPAPPQHKPPQNTNYSTEASKEPQDKCPQPVQSPDSGCFNSPPAPDTQTGGRAAARAEQDGNIEDVFQTLLGDLQPLSGWQTGGGVPLYMRGANATGDDQDEDQEKDQEEEDDQEEDQLNKAIALLQDRLFTLSCEEETQTETSSKSTEERPSQTYAGALRSSHQSLQSHQSHQSHHTDQLTRIRNIGTIG